MDLKLASSKLWAGCMLLLLLLSTLRFIVNRQRINMRQLRKPYPVWNDEIDAKWQLNQPRVGGGGDGGGGKSGDKKPTRFDDELDDVPMAMAAARDRYDKILQAQQSILRQQVRPDDKHYNINVTLSDRISMDRVVNDVRPPVCRTFHYNLETLPRASVVIPFYNEALSMLLRTVHSILNNSPDILLNEVPYRRFLSIYKSVVLMC